jgi:murein L,D-transpeptidase YcbB/YkuD
VVLVAGVWFRLIGTIVPAGSDGHPAETAALQDPVEPQKPAFAAPSAGVLALRQRLASVAGKASSRDVAAIRDFYQARNGPLVWVTPEGFSPKAQAAIAELRKADDWGLHAAEYDIPRLPLGTISPEAGADIEIKLTLAMLQYARQAYGGRIADPSRVSQLFDVTPPQIAPAAVLAALVAADAPDAYLRSLHPQHEQFQKLHELLVRLRHKHSPEAGTDEIAYGSQLKHAVPQLETAAVSVPRPAPAVRGLAADERARLEADIDRILVNMERWRWMPRDFGEVYVWNNVPEFMTRVWKGDKIINSDRIVAGQPDWPTPIFSAD